MRKAGTFPKKSDNINVNLIIVTLIFDSCESQLHTPKIINYFFVLLKRRFSQLFFLPKTLFFFQHLKFDFPMQ